MVRAFALAAVALVCLTAQSPPPSPAPASSGSEWTPIGGRKDLGFRFGCIVVPTENNRSAELVYFENDSNQPYDLEAGFIPDGSTDTSKMVNYRVRVDAGSVNVTFYGFSRNCGADKTFYSSNVYRQKAYMTPQKTADKSALWITCTVASHSMNASNGASIQLPVGAGVGGTYSLDERNQTLLVYDPQSKTLSDTAATFGKDEVTWFYGSGLQYHVNRKSLAFFRMGTYKEDSNLVTPIDITITDREDGQCQKTTAPT